MKSSKRASNWLNRCTPVGSVASSPEEIAAEIAKRLACAPRGPDNFLTVFVAAGNVYATRASSAISDSVGPDELVGRYTHRIGKRDIAEDIEAWRAAA